MPRRNEEDLLNPDRAFFRLIKDYIDGHLTKTWLKLYRARVVQVSREAGDLESSPPCPPNSVRARVYSGGLDANIPDDALNVFHPLLPAHISPPIEEGEHIFVIFEDQNYSSGYWISTIPSFHDLNLSDPYEREIDNNNSSNLFEGDSNERSNPNPILETGGASLQTQGRQENIDNFESPPEEENPWRGKRIIHIGDSMIGGADREDGRRQGIGPLPYQLRRILTEDLGASFYKALGRVGWGVNDWLTGRFGGADRGLAIPQPSVTSLKRRYNADIVLITLGGNDASNGQGRRGDYQDKVSRLWNEASSGVDFAIWCGPPSVVMGRSRITRTNDSLRQFNRARDQINIKIQAAVGSENFIDCRALTNTSEGRRADGIHFMIRAPVGRGWARLFIDKARNR